MKHIQVKSSFIGSIAHDPDTNKLQVKFRDGSMKTYENVTAEQFERFRNADSLGKYFNENFR